MKKLGTIIFATAAVLALATTSDAKPGPQRGREASGQENGRRGECRELIRKNHAEQRAEQEAFREQQREEHDAFREQVRDLDPIEKLPAILAHHNEQHTSRKAHHEEQHAQAVAFLTGLDCIPAEKKEEMLERRTQCHDSAVDFHAEMHGEFVAFTENLIADTDRSPQEKHKALKEFMREQHAKGREWMRDHRAECEGQRHGGGQPESRGPRGDRGERGAQDRGPRNR